MSFSVRNVVFVGFSQFVPPEKKSGTGSSAIQNIEPTLPTPELLGAMIASSRVIAVPGSQSAPYPGVRNFFDATRMLDILTIDDTATRGTHGSPLSVRPD
jgi:hypothetical protein